MPQVTALYAALLTLGFVWLATRVIAARRVAGVPIGTGADRRLERAVRAHGNFAEYVPLALVLLALLELNGLPAWGLHLLGTALLAGRALHAAGITREPEDLRFRVAGMATTFAVLALAALALLWVAVI